jgi:hypothetical protein
MRRVAYFTAIIAMLVGCAPSEATIQKAISQTQTAQPTATTAPTPVPTPTPIPLSEVNLEPLLVQPNDLPPGLEASQVRKDHLGLDDEENKLLAGGIIQLFSYKGNSSGSVTVLLFDDLSNRDAIYKKYTDGFQGYLYKEHTQDLDIGDGGVSSWILDPLTFKTQGELAFVHCHALISIVMRPVNYVGDVEAYAKRLDGRLKDVICSP